MTLDWLVALDFMTLGSFLVLATYLRSKITFLQKYLIPNNIVAGFLLFIIGSLGIKYLEIPADRYGKYIYHLFVVTFIAMSLRKSEGRSSKTAYATGLLISVSSGIQTIVGLLVAYFFILTIEPNLFPTFGYYILLGFSQGPGQAYSIGQSWEPMGFENAANIGLTFAAVGYIWAVTIGLLLIRVLKKKYKTKTKTTNKLSAKITEIGIIPRIKDQPSAGKLTTDNSAIDGFTFQIALVLLIYLITFLVLKGVEYLLPILVISEEIAMQLTSLLWGLHFVFASLFAILVRVIMTKLGWQNIIDTGLMTRISGSSLDFVVTAAIAAISISVLLDYLLIILVMSTIGGLFTVLFIVREVQKSGLNSPFERILALFGTMTGTLTTGLTLTRIIDSEFKTDAAQDQVLGAGIAVPFILPFMASMIIPVLGLNKGLLHKYYLINLAAITIYTILLFVYWRYYSKNFKNLASTKK